MALNLWDPVAVTAVTNPGIVEGETFPANSRLMFEFPERDGLAPCKFFWYDGGNMPSQDVLPDSLLPASYRRRIERAAAENKDRVSVIASGALFKGTKGAIFSPDDYGAKFYMLPEDQFEEYQKPEPSLPRITYNGPTDQRHKSEFVAACKGEGKTMSNFGYAGRLTETILVGNLAVRAGEGKRIEWDAANLKSPNMPELNQFVAREYRDGWAY